MPKTNQQLEQEIKELEEKVKEIEENSKVERVVAQVVIERENGHPRARALARYTSKLKTDDNWEDVTGHFDKKDLEDILNGS